LCFTQFIIANRTGSVPLILHARPTPAGERIWVWLRPGLALSDLEGRVEKLAVACWANEVRLVRASAKYAALLRVDIARRNPLIQAVDSPLPGLIPDTVFDFHGSGNAPKSPGMAPVSLDLPDVPEPAPDNEWARPSKHRRSTRLATVDKPVPEPVGNPHHFGSDNSNWI
jgi:hypothetical protein